MGWLRAMFSGHNPAATREIMRLAFRQNLRRLNSRPPPYRRWEAAANTLLNRYRTFRIERTFGVALAEVLPFVAVNDEHCEEALAEYAVSLEHEDAADIGRLRTTVTNGLTELLDSGESAYDPGWVELFNVGAYSDASVIPWRLFLAEELAERVFDAADLALTRLGIEKPWSE